MGTANHDAKPHPESYENIIRVCLCSSVAKKLIFMVEWNEDEVGFLEIDLVSHDGGNTRGDFSQTLNCVDIKSYWVDFATVKNKAQTWAASISAGLRLSI